ncbi:hypothetical protein VTP01DRAFT_7858 [Rhizomucor pusillus]|uniref:uncharacterized protein n=1 Tax=Rhizomucor pusillus TaxID=4840 RepID=UPI003744845B
MELVVSIFRAYVARLLGELTIHLAKCGDASHLNQILQKSKVRPVVPLTKITTVVESHPGIVTVPKSRAQTTTILGAISASGQVKFSLRRPQPPAMKRKQRDYAERINAGTVTGQDMFLRIADKLDNDISTVRRLNVAGFLHSIIDLRMEAMTMDCPTGYVCRLMPLNEQAIPTQVSLFTKSIIPFLQIICMLKHLVKENVEDVEAGPSRPKCVGYRSRSASSPNQICIPSCLCLPQRPISSGKRKREDLEEE